MEENVDFSLVTIEDEMRTSYMDYAMSVIIGRALPDVRDGLKPVHRRVLYAMHELRNSWSQPYKKSARVVGDVIGKYHPHGDSAVYDTIVRMAQDFSMRYLLVDGQGNFGSVDGDPAAAMRYTEVRMTRLAGELLEDLDKDTVDFEPNYDESTMEPSVLPAKVPNLLINGSSGIAVGMATNIPPHNLREVVDATIALINEPTLTIDDLMEFVRGPDFPTAGFIHGRQGIVDAYRTGRGIVRMRAKADIEEKKDGRESIIITELPYQVNKAKLLENIAGLVRDKRIEGISHLQDESDRKGMRVVIDLKRDAYPQIVLNQLFRMTPMQSSFGINSLAIVDGQPQVLNLKDFLVHFIDHRRDVVTRRCLFELRRLEARAHILEGYKIALENIDEVVELIKTSGTPEEARTKLSNRFGLTDKQAQAILDLRLQRLTGMERDKILEELAEVMAEIERLTTILASERLLLDLIVGELEHIRERYGDDRRTVILDQSSNITMEDLIAEEDMVVTVSHDGYVKRTSTAMYRSQHRGGKGKRAAKTKTEDMIVDLFVANTHTPVFIFTSFGKVFKLKVWELPEGSSQSRGKPIVNLITLEKDEKVRAILPIEDMESGQSIVFATRKGRIKKTALDSYGNVLSRGIIAIKLLEGDDIVSVKLVAEGQHVLLATRLGQSIRFRESDTRVMGRSTQGVTGMRLRDDDDVIGMEILDEGASILTVTSNGYGKRTATQEYRVQTRGGKGIITIKTGGRNGEVVGIRQVAGEEDLLLVTANGQLIRMSVSQISVVGRNTLGVRLFRVGKGAEVVAIECLEAEEEEDELLMDEEGGEGMEGTDAASAEAAELTDDSAPAEEGAPEDEAPSDED